MTIEEAIQTALFGVVVSLTSTTLKLPVAWPNRDFKPPADGSAYLEVLLFINRNERLYLGSDEPSWRRGFLQVNIFLPYNAGPEAGFPQMEQIVQAFPQDKVLRYGGVNVQLTKAPDVGSAVANPTGTRWIVPISVYYETIS